MDLQNRKRALLLINTKARRGQDHYSQAVSLLEGYGFELLRPAEERPEDLSAAISAARGTADLAIVGGGDGTLSASLDGLVSTQLPLGVLPLGTANSFAKTVGIPLDLPGACEAIARGMTRKVDLGCVNGKYFLNTASLGLSVEITQEVDPKSKKFWGSLAYFAKSLQLFRHAHPFEIQLSCDDCASMQIRTFQILVGNGRYFGGGMIVAPDASIDNRQLFFSSVEVKRRYQLISLSLAARSGRHVYHESVRSFYCSRIFLEAEESIPINTDGERTTQTPARFEIKPSALSVIVPQDSAAAEATRTYPE